jgi:hypothetical protein
METVDSGDELVEVVGTLHPRRGLTNLLDGRQEQANQDGDDRNDNE